ncbi:MAG: polyprenyl synthetase family protein [Bacteroidetes bacterium]|nr:MAG: polyprenyl synthetase family protein [Bacteroidota bacterium]
MKGYEELYAYFETNLKQQAFDNEPSELYAPIQYTLALGGKRIRPVLTLMACELFGGQIEKALPQAIAIELFHNFTLIHDDIMDDAPLRRGKKTVFKKWNNNIAVLSGDTLFALAYQYVQKTEVNILPITLSVFNKTAIEVCEGQQFDLNFETENDLSVDQYTEMIRLKTAVLFGASLKIGALIGGANNEDAESLYNFGQNIGLGFQLKDDLLDTFGDEKIFGKKTGVDIILNKKTFLYLKALEIADDETRNKLVDFYNNDSKQEEKFREVKAIFSRLKIDQLALEKIDEYCKMGKESLAKINLNTEKKESLLAVAHRMIDREK